MWKKWLLIVSITDLKWNENVRLGIWNDCVSDIVRFWLPDSLRKKKCSILHNSGDLCIYINMPYEICSFCGNFTSIHMNLWRFYLYTYQCMGIWPFYMYRVFILIRMYGVIISIFCLETQQHSFHLMVRQQHYV